MVTGATVVALIRAHHRNDREGVQAIVATSDPTALIDGLAEVAAMLGERAYGTPSGLDAALADLLRWLAILEPRRG